LDDTVTPGLNMAENLIVPGNLKFLFVDNEGQRETKFHTDTKQAKLQF
jgi:hypothetical protein